MADSITLARILADLEEIKREMADMWPFLSEDDLNAVAFDIWKDLDDEDR